jgi:hypothetical protein
MEKDSLGVTLLLRVSMNQYVMKHHEFNSVNRKIEIHWDMMTETPNEREPAVIQSKKRFPKGRLTTLTSYWRSEEITTIFRGLVKNIQRKEVEIFSILSDDLKFQKQTGCHKSAMGKISYTFFV